MAVRRLVLMNEDVYKNALKCLNQEAATRAAERTLWYEKDNIRGVAQRTEAPVGLKATPQRPAQVADSYDTADEPAEVTPPVELVQTPTHVSEASSVVTTGQPLQPNTKNIPLAQRKKYYGLLRKIQASKRVSVDSDGRIIFLGEPAIPNSSFTSLMQSLFVTSASADEAVGRGRLLTELKLLGVKPADVASKSARLFLRDVQAGRGRLLYKLARPPGKHTKVLRLYK